MSKSGVWKAFSLWVILALILALATVLIAPRPATGAATWYVDGTLGTDNVTQGTGPGINAFKTIQYAINDVRVVDSDTISVAAETYNEDIEINKGLTIQSSTGATNTIIRGSGGGSSYYMIRIYHSNVTFDGFTVTNPDYQGGADASGILIQNTSGINNIHILNNIIKEVRNGTQGLPSNYGAVGINIGRAAPSNIVISGNVIENIHNPNGASNDHTCGINVWDNGHGITISNNKISDIKYNGILLQYANNIHVISNTITQCQDGIKIDPYTGATVSGVTINHNVIVDNSNHGIDNHSPNVANAVNNWWGCNDGPGVVGPGSGDKVSNNINYAPWLVLNLCANPLSIPADGISTCNITADMTKNSNWQDTLAQGHIPDGTQIIFTTDKGSIGSPTTKPTTNGIATAVFTSDTSPSQATISARAPAWTACATSSAPVNMHQPGGVAVLLACDWVEYSNNPVFGQWLGGPKAYYPKVIYDASQFSGHGDSTYYKMWFGSSNGIGYAYSNNGTTWTAGTNPLTVLVPGGNHPLVEYDPNGFGHGVYYKMWYWTGVMNYTISNLHYAESSDGINWANDQSLTQDISYPLVTGNSGPDWNAGSYGPCDLIYNPSGSSSLDDGNLWNNKYVMYYMGTTGGSEFIGLAYSVNGTHWKRYGCTPVLSPGAAADWDNTSVGYCSVINIAGNWQMWYGGGSGTNEGIGCATSPDGISWTKHSGNPIFHRSDSIPTPWRDDRTYTPWVVYDAASFGGNGDAYPYKMWFSGKSTAGSNYSIGYAYSIPIDADAGTNQAIVPGGSTIIGGSPTASGGIPPYAYNWTPAAGLDNPSIANPTASPTITTTYTVTVTDSKGCTGSDNMTVSVQPPSPAGGGGAGGGGGVPATYAACPVTMAADIQGNITTVRATKDGVLCATCVAEDTSGKYTLQLDEDTQIISADNTVPLILRFQETSQKPPTPEDATIVGPVYEINAYSSIPATTPVPVTISPPATVILTYEPDELPDNTSEVFIANYDTEEGWQALASMPGVAAELGKAQGLTSHLSLFAVLATITEPATAKFEVSNLTVSPSQVQPNQRVTISLNVANTGSMSGNYSLELKVDGEMNSTKQVTIAPGTSQTMNLILTEDTAGKHRVEVAGLSGEFEVTEAKAIEPSGTNWWLIISVTAIILLIIVVSIALMR